MPRPAVDPGSGRPKLWVRSEIEQWVRRTGRHTRSHLDSHHEMILDGLGRRLDPRVFEECIVDLLGREMPVVPVPGGNDGGMDGAVFDGEGPAYPLIVTTAQDVSRNLGRSLSSYVENGGKRRKAVLATSSKLTPQRRRNLEDKASEMGFELVQIIERRGLADLLYRSPRWCKALLGLTGEPSPFSPLPPSVRPLPMWLGK